MTLLLLLEPQIKKFIEIQKTVVTPTGVNNGVKSEISHHESITDDMDKKKNPDDSIMRHKF